MLQGIKILRNNLEISSSYFSLFWELASKFFVNTSLILSKHKILFIVILIDKNLASIHQKIDSTNTSLNDLIHATELNGHGLNVKKLSVGDYHCIVDSISPLNKYNGGGSELDLFNLAKISKHGKSVVLDKDNQYRMTIVIDDLKLINNVRSSIDAILNIESNLIIGTTLNGKNKGMVIEIKDIDYEICQEKLAQLMFIFKYSPHISGNLHIIGSHLLKKSFIRYSFGLLETTTVLENFSLIVNEFPKIITKQALE